ncbi:hypothetical protein P7F88_03225 [Vibrio hannami]|uniref:hypothetical protein n=1 Tax=Vibrio hannami TaxID=2717094 RepID=UPI0024100C68|nr:hypothetical protein [Vibrio hannami]MDG3085164.1 hypothetical protein [Vibrio hannami]
MPKKKRVSRTKDDLKKELKEQISLLEHACTSFDLGLDAIGKHIALTLRVLLHHRGQSRSLLEQLGLRSKRFYDTAGPLNPGNLLTECNLVGMRVSGEGGEYMPMVQMGGSPITPQKIKFVDWWNNDVLKDNKGRTYCRRELVENVANTDGGAHVDPDLEEAYMDLSRNNSLGWQFSDGNIEEALAGRPELACMRQIAHEVLLTLKDTAPEYVGA